MPKPKQSETAKLRQALKRQISRMEKRGYNITPEVKEKIRTGKYQTLKSYKEKTYKKLYAESTYGKGKEQVSGTKGRLKERSEAAKKATQTRKYKEKFRDIEGQYNPETGEIYDSYYQDKERGGTMPQEDYEGNLLAVLEEFINKIEQDVPETFYDNYGRKRYMPPVVREEIQKSTRYLRTLLDRELANGRGKEIAKALSDNAGEVNDMIDRLFSYYESEMKSAVTFFANLITNRTLSMEELAELDAAQEEADGWYEPQ